MGALRDRIGRFLIPGRIMGSALAGPAANASTTIRLGFAPPTGLRVASVHVMPSANVALSVANHATFTVASGATAIAATTTETQALAKDTAERIGLAATVVTLPPGAPIDVTIASAAGGADLSGTQFAVQLEWQGA